MSEVRAIKLKLYSSEVALMSKLKTCLPLILPSEQDFVLSSLTCGVVSPTSPFNTLSDTAAHSMHRMSSIFPTPEEIFENFCKVEAAHSSYSTTMKL